ncbi:MAG: hypothetical protein ABH823_04345 [bacterium]
MEIFVNLSNVKAAATHGGNNINQNDLAKLEQLDDGDGNLTQQEIETLHPEGIFDYLAGIRGDFTIEVDGRPILKSQLVALSKLAADNNMTLEEILDKAVVSETGFVTALYLENTPVSNIDAVASLTRLEILSLYNTVKPDEQPPIDIASLKGLTSLWRLSLGGRTIINSETLSSLVAVRVLYLWKTNISDIAFIVAMPELSDLYINGTKVVGTKGNISALRLKKDSLLRLNITDTPLARQTKMANDLEKSLPHTRIIRPTVEEVPHIPLTAELEALSAFATANGLSLDAVLKRAVVTKNPGDKSSHVTKLYLEGLSGIKDLSALEALTRLEILSIYDLKGEGQLTNISVLAKLKSLRWVSLGGQKKITDFSPLNGLSELRVLYLWGTSVKDVSFAVNMPELLEFYVDGCGSLDPASVESLIGSHHRPKKLRHIDIGERFAEKPPGLEAMRGQIASAFPEVVVLPLKAW